MKKLNYIPLGIGMVSGITIGILLAPKSGKELRKKLENFINNMDYSDMKASFKNKITEISNDLKEIDKEEVLDEVKKQIKKVNKKIDKLIDSVPKDSKLKDEVDEFNKETSTIIESVLDKFSE